MAWRLVEVGSDEANKQDLTDAELIGMSIVLANNSEPDELDVYWRAYKKIQVQVKSAMGNQEGGVS